MCYMYSLKILIDAITFSNQAIRKVLGNSGNNRSDIIIAMTLFIYNEMDIKSSIDLESICRYF